MLSCLNSILFITQFLRRCLATRREVEMRGIDMKPIFSSPSARHASSTRLPIERADWSIKLVGRVHRHSNRHTPSKGSASCVQSFDDSLMVQFALRIAFRCVLHRYGSLDIRCWKWFRFGFERFVKNPFLTHLDQLIIKYPKALKTGKRTMKSYVHGTQSVSALLFYYISEEDIIQRKVW